MLSGEADCIVVICGREVKVTQSSFGEVEGEIRLEVYTAIYVNLKGMVMGGRREKQNALSDIAPFT